MFPTLALALLSAPAAHAEDIIIVRGQRRSDATYICDRECITMSRMQSEVASHLQDSMAEYYGEGGGGYNAIMEDIEAAEQQWYDDCSADLVDRWGLPEPSHELSGGDGSPIYVITDDDGYQTGWILSNDGGVTMTYYNLNPPPGTENAVQFILQNGINSGRDMTCG